MSLIRPYPPWQARLAHESEVAVVTSADVYPMTSLQAGMVFHSEFEATSAAHHSLLTLRVPGACQQGALTAALSEATAAHPALRTAFDTSDPASLRQLVHSSAAIPLAVTDLAALHPQGARERLRTWQEAERLKRFDWGTPPLMRAFVHLLPGQAFTLTLSFHHAILDRRSALALGHELLARYRAHSQPPRANGSGTAPAPADAAPAAYRAVAEAGHAVTASPEAAEFWRTWLTVPVTTLPRMPGYPAASQAGRDTIRLAVGPGVAAGLASAAARLGVPLRAVLLAAHLRALGMASGEADIVTGVEVDTTPPLAPGSTALGMFLNALPLRSSLTHPTWESLIKEAATAEQALAGVRAYPLAEIQQITGTAPLYEVLFSCQPDSYAAGQDDDAAFELTEETTLPLEAHFSGSEGSGPLTLTLIFQRREFPAAQVRRIGDYHLRALAAIAAGLSSDPRPSEAYLGEDAELLRRWNDTVRDYPPGNLAGMLTAQALATPAAPAVWAEGTWLTYADFSARVCQLARQLAARGVRPGDVVGVCLERSAALVIAVHAVVATGAAYLPLEPDYPQQRLAYMAADAGIRVVVTRAALATRLTSVFSAPAGTSVDGGDGQRAVITIDAEAAAIAAQPAEPLNPAIPPEALAYVIYTSGSTGRPKGAENTHRGIVNRLQWMQEAFSLGPEDRVVLKTPFSFDVSVWELFWPLLFGAGLVVSEPGGHVDAGYMVRLAAEQRVTTAHWVPALLEALLAEPGLAARVPGLRTVICSGEALAPAIAERFHVALPGAELHNLYGPTEAAIDVTWHHCRPGDDPMPIGAPIANTQMRIMDRFGGQTPVGVPGELCIAGCQVARGYLGRPGLTAEKFVPDPCGQAGSRMYRTGDLARWLPFGEIEYLGRIDHQVQLRGQRIELGEVESALVDVPGVRAAVVAMTDGPQGPHLTAFIVPENPAAPVEGPRLRRHLAAILPPHMVPSSYVTLPQLPLTPNGKVDRKALVQPAQPETTGELTGAGEEYLAPVNEVEAWLEAVWQELLGPHVAGTGGDFFALGGTSMLALCLATRVRSQFGTRLPLTVLFASPTISQLATWLQPDLAPA